MLYAVLPAKRRSALHRLHSSERQVDQYFLSEYKIEQSSIYLMLPHILFQYLILGDGHCAGLLVERFQFENWPGHFVEFLGKTFCSHSAPTQERGTVRVRVRYGCVSDTVTGKLSGKPNEMLGGYLALDRHPIQRGVVILLVAIETRISSGWVGHVTQIRT